MTPNISPNIGPNIIPNIGPNIGADICSACSALHIFVVVMPNAPTREKIIKLLKFWITIIQKVCNLPILETY